MDVIKDITIDKLRSGEIPAAANVVGYAFMSSPNTVAVFGGPSDRRRTAMETMVRIAKLARPWSNVLVARQENRIAGVLNYTDWPHCQMSPLESLKVMPKMILTVKGGLFRGFKLQSTWAKRDPHEPHWHVGPLGVLPELQGRGIGSRMLQAFCEFVDQRKDAAYLETDKPENVRLYERFGFVVTSEAEILGILNWFMWRAPR